jgi:hypothetical protein
MATCLHADQHPHRHEPPRHLLCGLGQRLADITGEAIQPEAVQNADTLRYAVQDQLEAAASAGKHVLEVNPTIQTAHISRGQAYKEKRQGAVGIDMSDIVEFTPPNKEAGRARAAAHAQAEFRAILDAL